MVIVIYEDDGPLGPCGQCMQTCSPWQNVWIFRDESQMRKWIKTQVFPHRRKSRVRFIGLDDDNTASVVDMRDWDEAAQRKETECGQ